MNILMITGCFAKNGSDTALGGMERAIYKGAKGLQKRGHHVKILASDSKDAVWKYDDIEVISCKTVDFSAMKNNFSVLLAILDRERTLERKIKKINKLWKIDVLHYAGWYGVGLMHFSEIPAVMRVSSYTRMSFMENFPPKKAKLLGILECMAVKQMRVIYAPSHLLANSLGADAQRDVQVIETPYVMEHIKENGLFVSEKIGKYKYVLFFGQLEACKGIYVIRDMIFSFFDCYQDTLFVFAGEISCKNGIPADAELKAAAGKYQDRLLFLGKLQKCDLIPLIRNAEFIVMPSIADNLPNACAEAMALGKIVVGTDGSSIEQFITDGVDGVLAKINDSDSLLEQVKRVRNFSEEQKRDMEQKAIEKIKKFDLDEYSRKVEELYIKVKDKKGGVCRILTF